jgi:hypothetical protein
MHTSVTAPVTERVRAPQKPLPKVRLATPDDLEDLLQMGRELHAENGLTALDEGAIRRAAEDAVLHGQGTFAVIGKDPIEAMIFLGLRQYWYSSQMHLEEMLNFVRPEFRRSHNAISLIEFAKSSAVKLGVPLLIGIVSNDRTAQKIRLYRRRLGEPAGGYWLFNAHTGKGA